MIRSQGCEALVHRQHVGTQLRRSRGGLLLAPATPPFAALSSPGATVGQGDQAAERKNKLPKKLRRGEVWDPQAQAQSRARSSAFQSRKVVAQPDDEGPANREPNKQAPGSLSSEDIGPRKSLFVQARQRDREIAKAKSRSAEKSSKRDRLPFASRKAQNGLQEEPGLQRSGATSEAAEELIQKGRSTLPPGSQPSSFRGLDSAAGGQPSPRKNAMRLHERAAVGSKPQFVTEGELKGARGSDLRSQDSFNSEAAVDADMQIPVPIRREAKGATATFFTNESFKEAGTSPELVDALAKIGITRPSHIQAAAIKAMAAGPQHLVLADHSGSGKTLAYLIPLIQQLRLQEASSKQRAAKPKRPSIVVLLPTTELAVQVLRVARALSQGGAPFRAIGITGGYKKSVQRDQLRETADVVVGTPGRLAMLLKEQHLQLDRCQAFVLDEVDVLLGDFSDQVQPLRASVPAAARCVLATASLPELTWMDLQGEFPGIQPVLGPGLHRPAPGSLEQLVDCSGGEEINEDTGFERKAIALLRVLKEQDAARTVVFCNKLHNCRKVENFLNRKGPKMRVLSYHAAIEDGQRKRNLEIFLSDPTPNEKEGLVLVCTDRASRGVDTAAVEHVVMFDFPRDPSEYVRRAGRTARGAGGQGVVSMLVLGRQVKLARQIMERNEKGVPLHRVPVG